MKFFNIIKRLNIVLTIFFLCINAWFGFFYLAGFYYFRYSLAIFAYLLVVFRLIESMLSSKYNEKEQINQGQFASNLKERFVQILEEEYAEKIDEDSFFLVDDDFFSVEESLTIEEDDDFFKSESTLKVEKSKIEDENLLEGFSLKNTRKYRPLEVPRDFEFVFSNICFLLPKEKALKLQNEANYWSPELMWAKLAIFVNDNVVKDSKNIVSVRIYAILCNKNESQIRKLFKTSGY